jgi:hypothetical protein
VIAQLASILRLFFRNVGWQGGPAPARLYIPDLLDDVLSGALNPGTVPDYETDLEHVADAYAAMDERRAIKSLIRVGSLWEEASMITWTAQELDQVGQAEELQLATGRHQGGVSRYVTMWVVRAGDDLYVRSAHGPDNPWYRRARAAKAGRIRAGGLERAVTFEPADAAVSGAIDGAYHAKYDRYGPQIVGPVTGPDSRDVTIRLVKAGPEDQTV